MPHIVKGHIEDRLRRIHETADSIMDNYAANAAAVKAAEAEQARQREIREWMPYLKFVGCGAVAAFVTWCLVQAFCT